MPQQRPFVHNVQEVMRLYHRAQVKNWECRMRLVITIVHAVFYICLLAHELTDERDIACEPMTWVEDPRMCRAPFRGLQPACETCGINASWCHASSVFDAEACSCAAPAGCSIATLRGECVEASFSDTTRTTGAWEDVFATTSAEWTCTEPCGGAFVLDVCKEELCCRWRGTGIATIYLSGGVLSAVGILAWMMWDNKQRDRTTQTVVHMLVQKVEQLRRQAAAVTTAPVWQQVHTRDR